MKNFPPGCRRAHNVSPLLACVGLLLSPLAFPFTAGAAVVIAMATEFSQFDEDVAGDTAGPFTDLDSGVSGTITHVQITDTLGVPGAALDFRATQSGVGNNAFSLLESWIFEWDVDSQFLAIDFSTLAEGFHAQIQSNAWIGAVITPGSSNVQFNSTTGTFQFHGLEIGDTFDQVDIFGVGVSPLIAAGTDITISSVSGSAYNIGTGFTWNLIPEPGAGLLALGGLGAWILVRRRRMAR